MSLVNVIVVTVVAMWKNQIVDREWLCRDIKLITPYTVNRGRNSFHYTYLDTVGRPVIMASKDSLVEQHIQDFEVGCTVLLCDQ